MTAQPLSSIKKWATGSGLFLPEAVSAVCACAPRPCNTPQTYVLPEALSPQPFTHLVIKQSRCTGWRQAAPVVLQAPDDARRALQPRQAGRQARSQAGSQGVKQAGSQGVSQADSQACGQSSRQAAESGCPRRRLLAHAWQRVSRPRPHKAGSGTATVWRAESGCVVLARCMSFQSSKRTVKTVTVFLLS